MKRTAILIFLASWAGTAYGIDPVTVKSAHTVITADRMVTDNSKNLVQFAGHVEAAHHDVLLKADKVDVYSDEKKETLQKIVADGNVTVTKGDRKLTGGHAELIYALKQVIVTGNPSVNDMKNRISGEKIVYSYDKEGIIMSGAASKKENRDGSQPKKERKSGK